MLNWEISWSTCCRRFAFLYKMSPTIIMELEPLYVNETTKHTWFPSNHNLTFVGSKQKKNLTGETRNHFPFIKQFRFFARFYWHTFTHRAALSRFLTLLHQKITETAAWWGSSVVFFDVCSLWRFFGRFVGCWTCVGSKTPKIEKCWRKMCAFCVTWRPMVGLKQHASWWFWRFFHCCPRKLGEMIQFDLRISFKSNYSRMFRFKHAASGKKWKNHLMSFL